MSIYSQISGNRWRTYFIFVLFIFLVAGFFFVIGEFYGSSNGYLIVGLLFSIIATGSSYFYSDKIVLFTAGAHPADKKNHFDFYTVAENLSIASGLPMPALYVIEDSSPNAFATGRDPEHAVVCATTGLLKIMDRAELEGVIAHELSHIKNYDILLSSVVAVLVGTIALASEWILRGGFRSRSNKNNRSLLFFALFIVFLILGPIAATLIQLAISRKREFLADASGALLTRYPKGLAQALQKIADYPNPLERNSSAIAHLYISNPLKKGKNRSWFTNLFSTHPPVEERINLLMQM